MRWFSSSGLSLISLFLSFAVFAATTMPFHGESSRRLISWMAWLHAIFFASLADSSLSLVDRGLDFHDEVGLDTLRGAVDDLLHFLRLGVRM